MQPAHVALSRLLSFADCGQVDEHGTSLTAITHILRPALK